MGNNNATAILTEEESSKLETNGMSSFESVSVETKQDQVFLAEEVKDEDIEKKSLPDGEIGKETPEIEPQDLKVGKIEEDINQSSLQSTELENEEKLQKQISVTEGVETVSEETEVEELSMIETQGVGSELNTTASGNEEKTYVIDESLEETVDPGEEVLEVEKETSLEQRSEFPEIESQEILNLHDCVVDDEVTNDEKGDLVISEPDLQESKAIQETGFEVSKEEKVMESGREASLKRMSRCRSLPVSQNSRVCVSDFAYQPRNKKGLEKPKTSVLPLVSCVRSNKGQDTKEAITESNKEARLEMRSPTFGNDLIIEERGEKTPLLCQDKTQTYETTINAEEKTVMLKRTESEETRGIELSLGLSIQHRERSEGDDSFKETKSLGDNLLDKKELRLVSCVESNKAQDTTEVITASNKEAVLGMRSPSFGNDLIRDESMENTPLLCQDKTETRIDVEEKTVMLKRSKSEKTKGIEISLGLSLKYGEKNSEADDNLLDKKASLGFKKVRKRSKSSVLGTCLCCATALN